MAEEKKYDISVSKFLAQFDNGVAKQNKYMVSFLLPNGVKENDSQLLKYVNKEVLDPEIKKQYSRTDIEKINIFCNSCTLPSRIFRTYPHKQLSMEYLVPYAQSYDQITFSFYSDKNLNTRRFFDLWQSAVCNIETNTFNYFKEFVSDVDIELLDDEGKSSYKIKLFDAFPINIGQVQLDYNTTTQPLLITVTLSFTYWVDINFITNAKSIRDIENEANNEKNNL